MLHHHLHFLKLALLFLLGLSCLPVKAQYLQDSLSSTKKIGSAQAATMPLSEKTLDELAAENIRLQSQQSLEEQTLSLPPSQLRAQNTQSIKKQKESPRHATQAQKQLKKRKKQHNKNTESALQKNAKKKRSWGGLHLNFKWIELDWFMIGLVIALFMGLMILLYFLFVGNTLSLFQMILFAMGFGFAIFSFIFLSSEADGGRAAYEFFVKYGVFSWAGIMAIFAGFAGLFGATVNFGTFLLIGLIIGGISFLLSLLLGDHLFMGYDQRKRN